MNTAHDAKLQEEVLRLRRLLRAIARNVGGEQTSEQAKWKLKVIASLTKEFMEDMGPEL